MSTANTASGGPGGPGPSRRPGGGGAKPAERPRRRLFMKQPMMLRMFYAMVPALLVGVYFFGWRVIALLGATTAAGLATEAITSRRRGQPISLACFVTCGLLALSLPPTLPFWMAAVGAAVAIFFGKEAFGGFGRNFANPALVGRAFIFVAFPVEMTARWAPAFAGFPGGFARWSMAALARAPERLAGAAAKGVDTLTAATPMLARQNFGHETPFLETFLGGVGRTFTDEFGTERVLAAGSIGEVCVPAILIACAYLLATRTANWRLTAGTLLGAGALAALVRHVLGVDRVPPLPTVFSTGALLYAAVFMITDPVSAPKRKGAMWIYGAFIGAMIVLLRWRSRFIGAVGFSVLLGNIIAPSLDIALRALADRRKAKAVERAMGDERKGSGSGVQGSELADHPAPNTDSQAPAP